MSWSTNWTQVSHFKEILYSLSHQGSPCHALIASENVWESKWSFTLLTWIKQNDFPFYPIVFSQKIWDKVRSHEFSSVQLLSHVQLFAIPWTTARQTSLSITNSQSLLKLMSIQSMMPSNHLILCHLLLLLPSIFPSIGSFQINQFFPSGGQSIGVSASASVLPEIVGNLISGSSAFSKTCLNIWKFAVHVLLKPLLEDFEHYFTSVWDECNCAVVWAFFGTQLSLWFTSHIHTRLLEKPKFWLDGHLSPKQCLCFLICCLVWP